MSKRSTVKPDWLDSMLVAWGRVRVREALGYPSESFMFKERVPSPARSYEPTGYSGMDFRELEATMGSLDMKYQLVILRCYKPWTAGTVEDELRMRYGVGERTWCNWLHEGAALILAEMNRLDDKRKAFTRIDSGYAEMDA